MKKIHFGAMKIIDREWLGKKRALLDIDRERLGKKRALLDWVIRNDLMEEMILRQDLNFWNKCANLGATTHWLSDFRQVT